VVSTVSTDTRADDRPVILLVSAEHPDELLDEFGRYARDYDVRATHSAREAGVVVKGLRDSGQQLALVVTESVLPDADVLEMFHRLRTYIPTCRRVVAASWERFRQDADRLRPGLVKGKYDAYLLAPRGQRDEEFHTAVCELLSDWNQTVAAPVVESLRVVSPTSDGLTSASATSSTGSGCPTSCTIPTARSAARSWVACSSPTASSRRTRCWSGGTATPSWSPRCTTWRSASTAGPTRSTSTRWPTW